jgi:hypothetical protein
VAQSPGPPSSTRPRSLNATRATCASGTARFGAPTTNARPLFDAHVVGRALEQARGDLARLTFHVGRGHRDGVPVFTATRLAPVP